MAELVGIKELYYSIINYLSKEPVQSHIRVHFSNIKFHVYTGKSQEQLLYMVLGFPSSVTRKNAFGITAEYKKNNIPYMAIIARSSYKM